LQILRWVAHRYTAKRGLSVAGAGSQVQSALTWSPSMSMRSMVMAMSGGCCSHEPASHAAIAADRSRRAGICHCRPRLRPTPRVPATRSSGPAVRGEFRMPQEILPPARLCTSGYFQHESRHARPPGHRVVSAARQTIGSGMLIGHPSKDRFSGAARKVLIVLAVSRADCSLSAPANGGRAHHARAEVEVAICRAR